MGAINRCGGSGAQTRRTAVLWAGRESDDPDTGWRERVDHLGMGGMRWDRERRRDDWWNLGERIVRRRTRWLSSPRPGERADSGKFKRSRRRTGGRDRGWAGDELGEYQRAVAHEPRA